MMDLRVLAKKGDDGKKWLSFLPYSVVSKVTYIIFTYSKCYCNQEKKSPNSL